MAWSEAMKQNDGLFGDYDSNRSMIVLDCFANKWLAMTGWKIKNYAAESNSFDNNNLDCFANKLTRNDGVFADYDGL